ncbi:MAG: glycosyltransferase [Bacteroidota bacterium]|nr:glycosyltransferase [Bacteroidota bacterium]
MPNVLILCAHRPKRSPSQRYRFEQYLPFLKSKGFNFEFSYLLNEKDDKIFYGKGKIISKICLQLKSIFIRLKDVYRFKKFQIIFIQREALFLGTSYFEKKAFKSGAKVIFDFDDSIWFADTSPENKKWEFVKKPEKFFKNIAYAHLVMAGNQYLKEKAIQINTNTVIIPTTIDTDFHVPKPELRNKDYITIGWSGSISTIKHFETLMPVLLKISKEYGEKVRFKIIGQTNYFNPQLKTESVNWSETTEVDNLNTFDIGIMPLPDDEWAKGKCGLKGLSYMACGVATIMSNVGVNVDIIKNGINGFLAANEADWLDFLVQLINDANLRREIGSKGRKTVEEKYSVIANKQSYLNQFSNL